MQAADTLSTLTIDLDANKAFNKISIFECCDVKNGDDGFSNVRINRIQEYQIDIKDGNDWITIYHSDVPMGDCKVIRFPKEYRTTQLRLRVLKALAPASIYELNVIRTASKLLN